MLVPLGTHQGRRPMTLNRPFTLVGSSPSARLYLPSKAVSRCHAVVVNADSGLFIRDLASRTQVRINGKVVREADLREGDVVQVGPFAFRFTDPTAGEGRPARVDAPPAELRTDDLEEPLPLGGRFILIGRRENADISLIEDAASSAHAAIYTAGGNHLLRDLYSRTGTYVNGSKVHEHELEPGDVIRVGETSFRYLRTRGAKSSAPKTRPSPPPLEAAPAGAIDVDAASPAAEQETLAPPLAEPRAEYEAVPPTETPPEATAETEGARRDPLDGLDWRVDEPTEAAAAQPTQTPGAPDDPFAPRPAAGDDRTIPASLLEWPELAPADWAPSPSEPPPPRMQPPAVEAPEPELQPGPDAAGPNRETPEAAPPEPPEAAPPAEIPLAAEPSPPMSLDFQLPPIADFASEPPLEEPADSPPLTEAPPEPEPPSPATAPIPPTARVPKRAKPAKPKPARPRSPFGALADLDEIEPLPLPPPPPPPDDASHGKGSKKGR